MSDRIGNTMDHEAAGELFVLRPRLFAADGRQGTRARGTSRSEPQPPRATRGGRGGGARSRSGQNRREKDRTTPHRPLWPGAESHAEGGETRRQITTTHKNPQDAQSPGETEHHHGGKPAGIVPYKADT